MPHKNTVIFDTQAHDEISIQCFFFVCFFKIAGLVGGSGSQGNLMTFTSVPLSKRPKVVHSQSLQRKTIC